MNSQDSLTDSRKPLESTLSSGIYVDQEGDWYYKEEKIIREDILELFLTNLSLASGGRFFIEWGGQRCTLEVADTPFIITRVDRIQSKDEQREEILLRLKHFPSPEILDPSTLQVGKGNIPYCTIRNGQHRARFSRPAYYQLAAWIEYDPDSDSFFLELNDTRYHLVVPDQAAGRDALGERESG